MNSQGLKPSPFYTKHSQPGEVYALSFAFNLGLKPVSRTLAAAVDVFNALAGHRAKAIDFKKCLTLACFSFLKTLGRYVFSIRTFWYVL